MDYALKFLEKDIYSLYSQVNDLFRLSKVNILDYKNYLLYSLYSQDTFFLACVNLVDRQPMENGPMLTGLRSRGNLGLWARLVVAARGAERRS